MTELPEIIYRHIPERTCTVIFRIERDNKGKAVKSYPLFDIEWGVPETPEIIAEIIRRCKQYESLKEKTYGWCNTCGALVVGDIEHLCDKCGGLKGKVVFTPEYELIRLKQALKEAKDD